MTDTPSTTPTPDAIRAKFHAVHEAMTASAASPNAELNEFRKWGEALADYVGKLHADVVTLQEQMNAVIDGVAELAGVAAPAAPVADPAPAAAAPVAGPAPAAPAVDPAPAATARVQAAPVEAAPVAAEPVSAAPAAADPTPADPTPADAPAAG